MSGDQILRTLSKRVQECLGPPETRLSRHCQSCRMLPTASCFSMMTGIETSRRSCPVRQVLLVSIAVINNQPSWLIAERPMTRAIASIKFAPRIGLTTYIVCMVGESTPVSHISLTIKISSSSLGSLTRFFRAPKASLLRRRGCIVSSSTAEPVSSTKI